MNRRGFLGLLAGIAGAAVLDPEILLWKPTKTIFVPPPIAQPVLSVRFLRAFDPVTVKWINRLDVIYGMEWVPDVGPDCNGMILTGNADQESHLLKRLQTECASRGAAVPDAVIRQMEWAEKSAHRMIGWRDFVEA